MSRTEVSPDTAPAPAEPAAPSPATVTDPPPPRPAGARVLQLVLTHGALLVLAVIFLGPVLGLVLTALKTPEQNLAVPLKWIPDPVFWDNFSSAFDVAPVWHMAANTAVIVGLQVIGVTASSVIAGYGFSLIRWRGQNAVFLLVVATMLVPYEVLLIPQYILFGKLGWLDTFYPLIVPYFFGMPLYIFLFRQFYLRLPTELGEAARIDGASEWTIFRQVYLPLARPAVLVVALLQFVAGWNDFIGPLIYLNDKDLSTLVLGMQYFRLNQYQVNTGGQAAYALIIVAPVVLVFMATQRRFIQGVALSSVKG